MHDQVPEAGTDSNVTSKTSLWDLRCELVSLLGSAHGAPTVEVSTGVLQRLKSAMREHVKYRIERRVFEQRRKVQGSLTLVCMTHVPRRQPYK